MQISNYSHTYNNHYKIRNSQQPNFEASLIPRSKSAAYENFVYKNLAFKYFNRGERTFKRTDALKDLLKRVDIPNGEKTIYGWDANPENHKKYVLFLHGIRGCSNIPPNQLFLEQVLKTGKYGVFTPEYRGTAALTNHKFSIDSVVEDAKTSLDYLCTKGIKPEDITVVSHCLGTIPTAHLAKSEPRLNKIIMVSPISQDMSVLSALFEKLHMRLPKWISEPVNKFTSLFFTESFDLASVVKGSKVPITVLSPEKDTLLSPKQVKKLAEKVPELQNIITIPYGKHSLGLTNCKEVTKLLD